MYKSTQEFDNAVADLLIDVRDGKLKGFKEYASDVINYAVKNQLVLGIYGDLNMVGNFVGDITFEPRVPRSGLDFIERIKTD